MQEQHEKQEQNQEIVEQKAVQEPEQKPDFNELSEQKTDENTVFVDENPELEKEVEENIRTQEQQRQYERNSADDAHTRTERDLQKRAAEVQAKLGKSAFIVNTAIALTENAIGESLELSAGYVKVLSVLAMPCVGKYGHHLESLEKLLDAAANVDEDTIYPELMATAAALGIAVPALRKVKAKRAEKQAESQDEAQVESEHQTDEENKEAA